MANSWLDQEYYLKQELSLLQSADSDSSITTTSELLTSLSKEGKTVQQQFVETGWKQGLDPSAGFDVDYYLEQVADEMGTEVSAVKMFMEATGIDPVTHYMLIGASLGLDPSEYFDTSYYAEQKAAFLNEQDVMGKTDWTADDAIKLMLAMGVNPLTDYQSAGWAQGLSPQEGFDTAGVYEDLAVATAGLTADQIPLLMALAGTDPLSYLLTYGLPDTTDTSTSTEAAAEYSTLQTEFI